MIIAVVWRPCAGAQLPIDPIASARECVAVTSGTNTAWIGLLLWPIALAFAGLAVVRTIARRAGTLSWVAVIVLATVTLLANPLPEYWLLNIAAHSWDEPPGTGVFTALTFVLAGITLLATREQRLRAPME